MLLDEFNFKTCVYYLSVFHGNYLLSNEIFLRNNINKIYWLTNFKMKENVMWADLIGIVLIFYKLNQFWQKNKNGLNRLMGIF